MGERKVKDARSEDEGKRDVSDRMSEYEGPITVHFSHSHLELQFTHVGDGPVSLHILRSLLSVVPRVTPFITTGGNERRVCGG